MLVQKRQDYAGFILTAVIDFRASLTINRIIDLYHFYDRSQIVALSLYRFIALSFHHFIDLLQNKMLNKYANYAAIIVYECVESGCGR